MNMFRLSLLILPLALVSCVDTTSQSHIVDRARYEISLRENWASQAYIRVDQRPGKEYVTFKDFNWKISAGAIDYSDYPNYDGIKLIPGTERELVFTRDGGLIKYRDRLNPCGYRLPETVVYESGPSK
ncbi:MAG: hypothetical protein AAGI48_05400 [Verrucomicrobiota bacterium]